MSGGSPGETLREVQDSIAFAPGLSRG